MHIYLAEHLPSLASCEVFFFQNNFTLYLFSTCFIIRYSFTHLWNTLNHTFDGKKYNLQEVVPVGAIEKNEICFKEKKMFPHLTHKVCDSAHIVFPT